MYANQYWWAWPLWLQSYGSFLFAFKNSQIFSSDHGSCGQKIEAATQRAWSCPLTSVAKKLKLQLALSASEVSRNAICLNSKKCHQVNL